MDAERLRKLIATEMPELVQIRRDLHRHPELGYAERRTSDVVVRELKKLGVQHVAGLARGTGVVAHLPATTPGASQAAIGLRADMDALPITEESGLAYASSNRGVMHACGHDGHTTNLLGVARVLSKVADRPNPVTLVFQPAEEGGAGGRAMCEDGALEGRIGPPVKMIYGLHGWPQLPVGTVGSRAGPLLAATDSFDVTIKGVQSHAAYPHFGRDPIVCAAQCITALQTIASRSVGPLDSVVVTVAMVSAGVARNVIPTTAGFLGTVRTLLPETRKLAKERLHSIVRGTAAAAGCEAEIRWEEGYPVTFNDAAATERFFRIAREGLGAGRVMPVEHPTMGGEDFAFYGQRVPACFFILGVRPPDRKEYPNLHQPTYDFNDDALATGIEMMCRLVLDE